MTHAYVFAVTYRKLWSHDLQSKVVFSRLLYRTANVPSNSKYKHIKDLFFFCLFTAYKNSADVHVFWIFLKKKNEGITKQNFLLTVDEMSVTYVLYSIVCTFFGWWKLLFSFIILHRSVRTVHIHIIRIIFILFYRHLCMQPT